MEFPKLSVLFYPTLCHLWSGFYLCTPMQRLHFSVECTLLLLWTSSLWGKQRTHIVLLHQPFPWRSNTCRQKSGAHAVGWRQGIRIQDEGSLPVELGSTLNSRAKGGCLSSLSDLNIKFQKSCPSWYWSWLGTFFAQSVIGHHRVQTYLESW